MHRVYKLHPHKHTGKLLHHRHTSYPVLVALILIVGVLIGLTGRIANADDLLVTATVPAPIPAGAPVFTSPDDSTVTDDPSVTFEGTCPVITPAVIIALYEGPTLLGSGICEPTGTFEITASLTPGLHTIVATVVTITNGIGESSAPLTVTYTPPPTPTNPTNPTSPNIPSGTGGSGPIPDAGALAPLDIVSDKPFITFSAELQAIWRASFRGGQAPYEVIIAWGDGTVDTLTISSSDPQTLTHTYKTNRLYTVSVTVKDQSGLSLTRYYVAMRNNGAPVSSTSTSSTAWTLPTVKDYDVYTPMTAGNKDGVSLSVAYDDNSTGSSFNPSSTISNTNTAPSFGEGVAWALNIGSGGGGSTTATTARLKF